MEEFWTIYALPVIQSLISPIVVGVVVFYLTNKRERNKDKKEMIHQLNLHYYKLKSIINLSEHVNVELDRLDDYNKKMSQMKNGDFSSIKEELESIGSEDNYFQIL